MAWFEQSEEATPFNLARMRLRLAKAWMHPAAGGDAAQALQIIGEQLASIEPQTFESQTPEESYWRSTMQEIALSQAQCGAWDDALATSRTILSRQPNNVEEIAKHYWELAKLVVDSHPEHAAAALQLSEDLLVAMDGERRSHSYYEVVIDVAILWHRLGKGDKTYELAHKTFMTNAIAKKLVKLGGKDLAARFWQEYADNLVADPAKDNDPKETVRALADIACNQATELEDMEQALATARRALDYCNQRFQGEQLRDCQGCLRGDLRKVPSLSNWICEQCPQEEPEHDSNKALYRFEEARDLVREGKLAQAHELVEKTIAEFPDRSLSLAARFYGETGDMEKANHWLHRELERLQSTFRRDIEHHLSFEIKSFLLHMAEAGHVQLAMDRMPEVTDYSHRQWLQERLMDIISRKTPELSGELGTRILEDAKAQPKRLSYDNVAGASNLAVAVIKRMLQQSPPPGEDERKQLAEDYCKIISKAPEMGFRISTAADHAADIGSIDTNMGQIILQQCVQWANRRRQGKVGSYYDIFRSLRKLEAAAT